METIDGTNLPALLLQPRTLFNLLAPLSMNRVVLTLHTIVLLLEHHTVWPEHYHFG